MFRGSTLFVLEQLQPLTMMDDRGFRRVRPGAEGLLKLVLNGSRWGGRPNMEGLHTKHVVELLEQDPEGSELAAEPVRSRPRTGPGSWPTGSRPVAGIAGP